MAISKSEGKKLRKGRRAASLGNPCEPQGARVVRKDQGVVERGGAYLRAAMRPTATEVLPTPDCVPPTTITFILSNQYGQPSLTTPPHGAQTPEAMGKRRDQAAEARFAYARRALRRECVSVPASLPRSRPSRRLCLSSFHLFTPACAFCGTRLPKSSLDCEQPLPTRPSSDCWGLR